MYRQIVKPVFDWIGALAALILFSPIFVVVILVLAVTQRRVWFVQPRPGYKEKMFRLLKFRTMNEDRDATGNLLADEKRLKGFGRFVRKTSLDELPQLINVLKGEMSLIGPRPLLEEYLPLYNKSQRVRHHVRPGITGWAQVNGRNAITWQQKFEYDRWYVENLSFTLDMKILFLTIAKVLTAKGINSPTSATMEKFAGNG